jgi:hypothetical protein
MEQLLQTRAVSYTDDREVDARHACLSLLRMGKYDAVRTLIHSLPNSEEMHRIMLELAVEHSLYDMAEYLARDRCIRLDYDNGRIFRLAVDGKKWEILTMLSKIMFRRNHQ